MRKAMGVLIFIIAYSKCLRNGNMRCTYYTVNLLEIFTGPGGLRSKVEGLLTIAQRFFKLNLQFSFPVRVNLLRILLHFSRYKSKCAKVFC